MAAVPTDLWDEVNQRVGLDEPEGPPLRLPIQTRRRRGYSPSMQDGRARLHLVDDDGLRRWVYEPPAAEQLRRRAALTPIARSEDVFKSFAYPDYTYADRGPNQITQALSALDGRLTPNQGLRRWDETLKALVPVDGGAQLAGPVLLLIHGTFSNSDMYLDQWNATPEGQALWQYLQGRYKHILAFDHPTLSVGAWINALDLHAALRAVAGPIHVLTHSRGGLVASWWLRLAPQTQAAKVIYVGSPLDGTSLASPYRLRAALDHLATVADLLGRAGEAMATVAPIAAGAAGLAKIFGRVLKLGSALPLADAAVAMVPGLATQQRTNNNAETLRLFSSQWLTTPDFYAVAADFEPSSDAPLWQVWTRLKTAGAKMIAGAADLVFDGPNDLVVDTAAMAALGPHNAVPPPNFLDLGRCNTYHTSYFRDPKVVAFLRQRL